MIDNLYLGSTQLADTATRAVVRVEGLSGPPGVRGDTFPRPEADGVVEASASQYLSERIISVEGEVWGATISAAWGEFDTLCAAFNGVLSTAGNLRFQRAGGGIQLQCAVRLAGPVLQALEGGEALIRYQAQLRAADPLLYSQTEQSSTVGSPTTSGGFPLPVIFPIPFGTGASGGSLTATNGGNVATWPRIVIQGPVVGPVVVNSTTGQALYFDSLTLASGQTLTIECAPALRSALVAGASVLGSLRWADSDFLRLAVGANTVSFYGIGGGYAAGTTMSVYWRDAYVS